MRDVRQRLRPTGAYWLGKLLTERRTETSIQKWRRQSLCQACVHHLLNHSEPAASLTARNVIVHREMKLRRNRTIEGLQHGLTGLFAIHRFSLIISASARRARCKWLFTVFSGIPIMSATSPTLFS